MIRKADLGCVWICLIMFGGEADDRVSAGVCCICVQIYSHSFVRISIFRDFSDVWNNILLHVHTHKDEGVHSG